MSIRERLSGNEAVAFAMKQINPDVVAAFPITPSTEIPQYFSNYVDNGEVDTEFIAVEGENSAMSACIGAEAAGARAMTATSANGLEYMWEMVQIASGSRLPIVMALVDRAISGPLNIHSDHSDAMAVRDSGWIMLFSETNQEAYDNMIMAHRIAENKDVMLPLMVCQDGFITSHAIENIELIEDEKVKKFIGVYKPEHYLLNKKEPISVGPMDLQAYLTEHKKQQSVAMENAKNVIKEIDKDFEKLTGRHYDFFEGYKLEAPKIYEYDSDSNICVSKAVDIRKLPKAHIIISLSEYELENYGGEYLISMLHHYIRPTEIDNIKKQYNEMYARIFKLCRGKIGRYVEL